jgi:hypothetical protein
LKRERKSLKRNKKKEKKLAGIIGIRANNIIKAVTIKMREGGIFPGTLSITIGFPY